MEEQYEEFNTSYATMVKHATKQIYNLSTEGRAVHDLDSVNSDETEGGADTEAVALLQIKS